MVRHGATAEPRRLALRRWIPYLLLVVTSILSVYAAGYVSAAAEERRRAAFLAAAKETRAQIDVRLDTYVEVVRASTALLAASNEIHHTEFRAFVSRLDLGERYPGLDAIGFSPRVTRRDLAALARAVELDGEAPLRIRPTGGRPEYQPILFIEPADSVADAIGFDLATDPVQREAMDRARDTGLPALSAGASHEEPAGLLAPNTVVVYAPVYTHGAPTATIEQRRRALHGFVFSPLRPEILFGRLASVSSSPVTFEVHDGGDVASVLIHPLAAQARPFAYQSSGVLSLAGREWLVIVKGGQDVPGLLPAAQNALIGGLLLSAMLFAITRIQIGAWETARRHAWELQESERALRAREAQLRELVALERAARSEAQQADRAKDDFLAGLSHELRTPLNAMLGWLMMLKSGTLRADRRAHALEVVERNARHQARLIEDLLDVSRILLGRMAVTLQPVDLQDVVAAVVDSLGPSAAAKDVEVQVQVATESTVAFGDAARLHQVVWNLVSNAIKFTSSGGLVTVELSSDEAVVDLGVRDTGVGIAAEFLPHVFERFRQADTSPTRSHSGLGLGLAITRHLVELHGGSIDAYSDGIGRGARFAVRLPAVRPDDDRAGPALPGEVGLVPGHSAYESGGASP